MQISPWRTRLYTRDVSWRRLSPQWVPRWEGRARRPSAKNGRQGASAVRKLLQVGDRVIDLAAVVAAEKGESSLVAYLAGLDEPFRFAGNEAGAGCGAPAADAAAALAGVAPDARSQF